MRAHRVMITQESIDGRTVGAIWAAEIWTPLVRVWKGGQPRQPKLTLGALGAADRETRTGIVAVSAARRHVLYSEGENCRAPSWWFVLAVVGGAQVDVVRRCEGCSDHVCRRRRRSALLCTQLVFDASGEALSYEGDHNVVAAAALHAHT